MSELTEAYKRALPNLRRAEKQLLSILNEVVSRIEDKKLVRAEVRKVRRKEISSLAHKAEQNGWDANEALRASDLIGGRVVCNNIDDVYRFAELLKERLPSLWSGFEIQDYIRDPKNGYSALHVNFHLNVSDTFGPDLVPCEVQIRSRLQDAWAELSHDDIFKQPGLPEDLRARADDLAEVLASAEKIASSIRARVVKETVLPEQRPNLSEVSGAALAFIFSDVFGRSPPDYLVRLALDLCNKLDVASLERFREVLGRTEFRECLGKAYQSIVKVPIGNEDLFLVSLYALAGDDDQAVKQVRRQARREQREIEEFARREALHELPEDPDDFLEQLGDGQLDIMSLAGAVGGATDCARCGANLVSPVGFEEAISDHYEVDFEGAIEERILNLGVDVPDFEDYSFCSNCAHQLAKDD